MTHCHHSHFEQLTPLDLSTTGMPNELPYLAWGDQGAAGLSNHHVMMEMRAADHCSPAAGSIKVTDHAGGRRLRPAHCDHSPVEMGSFPIGSTWSCTLEVS